jgi:hypothetical protein
MNDLSRKIVVIIIGLFLQSSLGTNAALKDFSNVSTKNFSQNGYYKLPDGLMIQWGVGGKIGDVKTIYLPVSFYDTTYNVVACSGFELISEVLVSAVMVYNKNKSNFTVVQRHASNDRNGIYTTGYPFNWFAIGRWK